MHAPQKEEGISNHDPDDDDDNNIIVGHLSKRAIAPVPIPPFDPFTKTKKVKKKLKKAAAAGLLLLTSPVKKSPKLLKLGVPLAGGIGTLGLGGLAASQVLRGGGGGGGGAPLPFRPPPPMFRPVAQGQDTASGRSGKTFASDLIKGISC